LERRRRRVDASTRAPDHTSQDDVRVHLEEHRCAHRAELRWALVVVVTTSAPSVELDGVSVRFGGLQALRDVSFAVSHGEIVGLIGPNGAGKTTAFNVMCGFVRPTTGRVRFPASSHANLRPSQLARAGVARTLQGVGLFPHCTVLENVMAGGHLRRHGGFVSSLLALPWAVRADQSLRADALDQLERLGVAAYADRVPGQIPFGVSKKVAVARALMCRPTLLLLDEPASGLDDAELDEFARLITELRAEMAILLVEHDMTFVMPLVERLVVLDFGQVIAEGTPREVQANPAVVEAYLGVQQ
jgi:branched-chain amino acid transport system ATP-binding protein